MNQRTFLAIATAMTLTFAKVFSCGDVLLQAKDGSYLNARSLEFGLPLDAALVIHSREEANQSNAPGGGKGLKWTSKYGYIGVNSLGINTACDGMNEKGLSLGALWLPTSVYQTVPKGMEEKALVLTSFGGWILGNFATVDEVKKGLKEVYVWGEKIDALGMIPPLHFAIHDTSGKSIVIEFINGQPQVHDNPVGILTNYPTFDWQLDNLRNYLSLRPVNAEPIDLGKDKLTFIGQGSGLLGIPGDWMPASRFIRLAFFKYFATPATNAEENLNLANHLFNTVDIPIGEIREKDGHSDYTQWVIFKDMTNLKVYFRSYKNLSLRMVDFKSLDLAAGNKFNSLPIESPGKPQDLTANMKK